MGSTIVLRDTRSNIMLQGELAASGTNYVSVENFPDVQSVEVTNPSTSNSTVSSIYQADVEFTLGTVTTAVGDLLNQILIFDPTGSLLTTVWYNNTQGEQLIGTVDFANVSLVSGTVAISTSDNQIAGNVLLTSIDTKQGTSGTGITQPTGGSGILGWLSGIYNTLLGNSGLYTPKSDSIYPTYGTTADQYVYKLNGATVLTRTINYTDSTKSVIQSITQG